MRTQQLQAATLEYTDAAGVARQIPIRGGTITIEDEPRSVSLEEFRRIAVELERRGLYRPGFVVHTVPAGARRRFPIPQAVPRGRQGVARAAERAGASGAPAEGGPDLLGT